MSLKEKVLTGTKWVALANIFKQILQVVSLIIFARLLTPEDFGMYAVLMIFVGFMSMFTDMGTGAALIHIKRPSDTLYSSVFYFNLFVGLLLSLSLILMSSPIAQFFQMPKIKALLEIISFTFIIASFGVVQKALYEKSLNFKTVTIIEIFSSFLGVTVGISAAFYGLGVLSLIIQTLSQNLLLVVLFWTYSTWRPMFYFKLDDIKYIWQFTKNLSLFNIVNYFARNADNFLIGKFLGSPALGVYSVAYKIMLYPLSNVSRTLLRILFPAFAKIQDDNKKFQKAYLRVIFFIALVTFPLMVGLITTADVLVPVLFGNKWHNLDILLIILAPIGMIQSIMTTLGSIYMAKGDTKTLMNIGFVSSTITVLFFILGLPFGVEGVAFSYLISNLIILYPVFRISWKQIDLSVKRGFVEIAPILVISILMGIGVIATGKIIDLFSLSQIFKLIIMILSGITIYYLLVALKYGGVKSLLKELKA